MLELNADLVGADLALAAASHTGEPEHVHRTLDILGRSGFTEDDLGCPEALPSDPAAYRTVIRGDGGPRRVYMNCSGKHAAMLATCRVQAWPTAGYLDRRSSSAATDPGGDRGSHRRGAAPASASTVAAHRSTPPSLVGLARGFGTLATARAGNRRTTGDRRHAGVTRTWSAAPASTTPS